MQIVFAGKAHPADEPGKALIQFVYQMSQQPGFAGRIVFVEDYDINIARHLVAGVDVWLNNPRRPLEASGTSGQKAGLNGVPNLSVLDGWWVEGYDGHNGWAIGEEREYADEAAQDEADALSLYHLLENEIVPLFYERDEHGIPHGWLAKMRASIATVAPQFSFNRMLKEYVNQLLRARRAGAGQQVPADNARGRARSPTGSAGCAQVWPQVPLVTARPAAECETYESRGAGQGRRHAAGPAECRRTTWRSSWSTASEAQGELACGHASCRWPMAARDGAVTYCGGR